jgi:hypothetical protein
MAKSVSSSWLINGGVIIDHKPPLTRRFVVYYYSALDTVGKAD